MIQRCSKAERIQNGRFGRPCHPSRRLFRSLVHNAIRIAAIARPYPIAGANAVAPVAKTAVAAARKAIAAVARLADHPAMEGEPPLDIVVALHVGTVHYGNIGAADRLDFTVIGPAVNLVSRIENAAKMLGQPIVVSAELAAALDGVVSLGRHQLRGLTAPQELFAPD